MSPMVPRENRTPSCPPALALFYPLMLAFTLVYIWAEVHAWFGPPGRLYPLWLAGIVLVMLVLERLAPLRPDWSMTRELFLSRDAPMMLINGLTIAVTTKGVLWFGMHHGGLPLFRSTMPWWFQAMAALIAADLVWYWVHRYSHESRSALGRWLWKTHALHHLPSGVYVLMHPAAHPLNSVYVKVILMLPAMLVGMSPEAVLAASVFSSFQGLVSHFNVDARAGLFNRVLVGTELHRFHHSADPAESKNYAATFSLWDQLFGTYVYRPGSLPAVLGVQDRSAYPADKAWKELLSLPFAAR